MKDVSKRENKGSVTAKQKVLLVFLPFWTPYIAPQGITVLKAYLQQRGYECKTADPNMAVSFRLLYDKYFNALRSFIPEEKKGNYFNIGHDVLFNHMMSHLHQDNEEKYVELVKELVHKTYYFWLDNDQVRQLNSVLDDVYRTLEDYLVDLLEKEKPDVFGSTAYYGTLPASMYAFRLVREKYPHIKTTIGGGSFADHLMENTPNFEHFAEKTKDYIDKIFIGQGQILYYKWLEGQLDDSKRIYSLSDIKGETVPLESNGDIPDLSDLIPKEYIYMAGTGSRSCPYECGFCNVKNFWGPHKIKDIKQTVDELILQFKQYGNQLCFMYDALLNSFIDEFSKEFISRDEMLYYVGYLKACDEACDVKNTLQWRRGGFYRARLGLESGSQRVLDLINKGITPDQIKQTVTNLAYAGIKTTTYWICGYPGETEEDFQMTLDLIEELKNDIWEAECNPFNYFWSGQQREDDWSSKRRLLYPEWANDWLVTQTWTLDLEPSREEVYRRVNRFVQHCEKLGIPNPYSIQEIYAADERWKRLHKNAVPSIAELRDPNTYIDDSANVKELLVTKSTKKDDGDFIL